MWFIQLSRVLPNHSCLLGRVKPSLEANSANSEEPLFFVEGREGK